MGLLERVSTLIRANINDLVDRAEDPEKLIKQVILDMENQFIQVKTQVAVSIADQHMLEKKLRENEDTARDWMRKAEIAVDKLQDDLARAALDRFQTSAAGTELPRTGRRPEVAGRNAERSACETRTEAR
jgi:phage shock protein A